MNYRQKIRLFWVGVALLLGVAIGVITLVCRISRPASPRADALFGQYRGRDDVKASLVRGLRVDDSVRVDVLSLQAVTDSAWRGLVTDYGIRQADTPLSSPHNPSVYLQLIPRLGQEASAGADGASHKLSDVAVFSPERGALYLFLIEEMAQLEAIISYQFSLLSSSGH